MPFHLTLCGILCSKSVSMRLLWLPVLPLLPLLPLLPQASQSPLSPLLLVTASQPTLPQPLQAPTHPRPPLLIRRHLLIVVSPMPESYLLDPLFHPTSLLQPLAPVEPQSMWGPPCQASSQDRWGCFSGLKSSFWQTRVTMSSSFD